MQSRPVQPEIAADGSELQPFHAFDLPPLYTQPSYESLLRSLKSLCVKLEGFDAARVLRRKEVQDSVGRNENEQTGIPRYLTSIISNPLAWIVGDEAREQLWELASLRLSERSGRSAAPSTHRTFCLDLLPSTHNDAESSRCHSSGNDNGTISLTLHEPTLTGDNLGHKTWASSYILCQYLRGCLSDIKRKEDKQSTSRSVASPLNQSSASSRVLELGAGTGLLGLYFAALASTHVDLTDLPTIVPNLEQNIQSNQALLHSFGGSAEAFELDWSTVGSKKASTASHDHLHIEDADRYDIILVADPLYSPEHPELVVNVIAQYLNRPWQTTVSPRVITGIPIRAGYLSERQAFSELMSRLGLSVLREGVEKGNDDWRSGGDSGGGEVSCSCALWGWKNATP